MGEQREQGVAEHAVRRLRPSREQQPQEPVDVLVVEALAVDLGVHDVADEVGAGIVAAVLDDRAEVLAHGLGRGQARLVVGGTEVDLLGPLLELGVVLDRHAQDGGDDLHREGVGDVGDQVGPAERRDAVEQRVDRGLDELVAPPLERRRPERLGDEVAVAAVLVTVLGQDDRAHHRAHGLGIDRRRERLVVAQHVLDVAVTQHPPRVASEGADHDGCDRLRPPSLGPDRVRVVDRLGRRQVGLVEVVGHQARRSMTVALAWPPPSHMVWKP